MDFSGKRVLVTGAGKGIGRATVVMLAARGAQVVALSRDPSDLQTLATETGCETIVCDLGELSGMLEQVRGALPLDLLVNNAGITALEPFLTTSLATFERIMRVNTQAPLLLMQMFAAELIGRGAPGAVVNVSSNAAHMGTIDHAAYCASKAALDALTRVAAVELGRHGIRINSVNPTVTLTPMGEMAWSDPAKSGPVLARIPLGRFLQADEVASAICFLLSDDAAAITGTCLDVDNGFRPR
jgi:NAD(P)-dependent dehydrogenase (short-subunit alcohol dehydrogenase family)